MRPISTPPAPRAAIFDLGGVACRFLPDRRLSALARASGLSADEVRRRLFATGFDQDCDRGRYTLDEQCAEICARLGVGWDTPRLAELWANAFDPDATVLAVVDRLRRASTTALLTNNGPLVELVVRERWPEVAARFDHLCFSYQVGALKPDPSVFQATRDRLGLRPEQCVFVDDTQAHVDGARAVGLDALLFVSADALASWLQARGLV